jgi:hypothetical protein
MDRSHRHTRGGDADTHKKPVKGRETDDALVDESLEESFPASDPPAITQPTKPEPPAPKKRKPD